MSTKYPSPLLGYNNNVRHKGRVFHIQTEDSGAKYGHIITHLFMDGGRILKSVKTSYTEYVGSERMSEIVREMMKQQHKAMFIALRDGKFDPMAADGAAPSAGASSPETAAGPSPGPLSPIASAIAEVVGPAPALPKAAAPAPSSPRLEADRTAKYASQSVTAMAAEEAPPTVRQSTGSSSDIARAADSADALTGTGQNDVLHLDVGAIERVAAGPSAEPLARDARGTDGTGHRETMLRDSGDLPPPPANLFREKGTGRYRSVGSSPPASADAHEPAGSPEEPSAGRSSPSPPPPKGGAGERRYAPTRPASIFGQARPAQGKSIFGGDLISDKSLDEVILSYLAEDLDEKK